jgi:disulfide bond formation protein DsbB
MCLRVLNTLPKTTLIQALAAMVLFTAAGALIFALTAQYAFGFQPCILCLYQRWPYRLVILLSGLAFLISRAHPRVALWLIATCIPLHIIGGITGFFQVGVEQKWWRGFAGCSSPDLSNLSPAQILAELQSAPVVPCDIIQFEFLGLSMAAYNALLEFGLAAALAVALIWIVRQKA